MAWRPLLALLSLTVAACSAETSGSETTADAGSAAAPARAEAAPPEHPGKALFEANCASCHGPLGLGDGPAAATLAAEPANIREHFGDHSYDEMVRRVVEGIPPGMPPAPIPPEQVGQALSYVWSLIPQPEQARLRALQEMAAEEH